MRFMTDIRLLVAALDRGGVGRTRVFRHLERHPPTPRNPSAQHHKAQLPVSIMRPACGSDFRDGRELARRGAARANMLQRSADQIRNMGTTTPPALMRPPPDTEKLAQEATAWRGSPPARGVWWSGSLFVWPAHRGKRLVTFLLCAFLFWSWAGAVRTSSAQPRNALPPNRDVTDGQPKDPMGFPSHAQSMRVLKALFDYCTRPVPSALRLVAELEIVEPAWTEAQVMQEARRQDNHMARSTQLPWPSREEAARLREYRTNLLRSAHSGYKRLLLREWMLGNDLWRVDLTDTSVVLLSNLLSRGLTYHKTFVNIQSQDPIFRGVRSYRANHEIQSATLDMREHSRYARFDLWQALIVEPEAALPLVALTLHKSANAPATGLRRSFSGLAFDEGRARTLLSGADERWIVQVVNHADHDLHLIEIRLKERPRSDASGTEITYMLDGATLSRMLRINLFQAKTGARYSSIRTNFDAEGFPRLWMTEATDEKGVVVRKKYTFSEIDLAGASVAQSDFAPIFPTNYIVAAVSTSGEITVLQNPLGARILTAAADRHLRPSGRRVVLYSLLVIALLVLPFCFLRQVRRTDS